MSRWLLSTILMTFVGSIKPQTCTRGPSVLKGEQITCTNVTADFFKDFTPQRAHWLSCENCDLETLNQTTFNFKRNNISHLVLAKNNVKSLRSSAFAKFNLLKVLSLCDNVIENVQIGCFGGLKRLLQLDLNNNLIGKLTENMFAELENLDWLNLDHNEIYHVQQGAFNGLNNVKHLFLNYNNLEELSANVFKPLTSLKILYLQNNRIAVVHSSAFTNLANLNHLYLNNNSITYLMPYNFKPLVSLIDLQMRCNNLEEIQTSSFNGLRNLRSLHLGENHIKRILPYGFVGLNNLENLELIGNDFESFDLDYFKDLTKLITLWLENNRINKIDIHFKSDFQNSLRVLSLKNNNLTFLNYKLLYNKIPYLTEVYVRGNPWRCEFLYGMYKYFANTSVLLCSTDSCSAEDTETYVEHVCASRFGGQSNETDTDSDFSTDGAVKRSNSIFLVVIYVLLKLTYAN